MELFATVAALRRGLPGPRGAKRDTLPGRCSGGRSP